MIYLLELFVSLVEGKIKSAVLKKKMVKVLNTNGILTLNEFVHALRHGVILEQVQKEMDKCSFTGSLGCPQERDHFFDDEASDCSLDFKR